MKLARILSSIMNKTKMALGTVAMQLLLAWLPKPLVTYIKIWLPLLLVIFSYFKIFHMILGLTFFVGLLDLTNLSFTQILEKLLLCKNYIVYNILIIVDKIFNTSYTSGPPSVEIKIGKIDRDMFGIPSPIDRFEQDQALYQSTIHSENEPSESGWTWTSYLKAGVAVIVVVGLGYLLYTNYDDIMEEIRNMRAGRHDGPSDGNGLGPASDINVHMGDLNPNSIIEHLTPLAGNQTEFLLKSGNKVIVPNDKLDMTKHLFDSLLNRQDQMPKILKICEENGISLLNIEGSAIQILGDKTPLASTSSLPNNTPTSSPEITPESVLDPSTHIINEGLVQKIDSRTHITNSRLINSIVDTIPVTDNPFAPLKDFKVEIGQHTTHIDKVNKYFETGLISNYILNTFNSTEIRMIKAFIELNKSLNFKVSRSNNITELVDKAKECQELMFKNTDTFAEEYASHIKSNPYVSEVIEDIVETEYNLLEGIIDSVKPDTNTNPYIILFKEFSNYNFNNYNEYKDKIKRLDDIFDEILTYKIHNYEYRLLHNLISYYKNVNIGIVNSRCIEEFLYLTKRACMDCEIKRVQTLYKYEEYICKKDQFVNIINCTSDIERELLFEIRSIFNYY